MIIGCVIALVGRKRPHLMKQNKKKDGESSPSGNGASSPFGKGTSAIFHSEDDVLVYEDFIRRSRQLAIPSQEQQGQDTGMTNTLATASKFDDDGEGGNQQTTMNNNQTQQSANFEPDILTVASVVMCPRTWRQWMNPEWTSRVLQLLVAPLTIC